MPDDEKDKHGLTDEVVQRIKRNLLFGDHPRNPPESTRFKKGQSGNPKGRPKTILLGPNDRRSANAILLGEAERSIAIREGGNLGEVLAIDSVFRKQFNTAIAGNAYPI